MPAPSCFTPLLKGAEQNDLKKALDVDSKWVPWANLESSQDCAGKITQLSAFRLQPPFSQGPCRMIWAV